MIKRLADASYRHRRLTLVAWLGAFVAFGIIGTSFKGEWKVDFGLPNTDSQRAMDLQERLNKNNEIQGQGGKVVFKAPFSVNDDRYRQVVTHVTEVLVKDKFVDPNSIYDPYVSVVTDANGNQIQTQVSKTAEQNGTISFTQFAFRMVSGDEMIKLQKHALELGEELQKLSANGVSVDMSGELFKEFEPPSSELFGVMAAVVILLVAFGSIIAMGLPILVAVMGISIGVMLVYLIANLVAVPDFTLQVASMIGLGVGIDYALFIVTRYRAALHRGVGPESAVVEAMDTAGRAVVFAGCTVVISLMGMFAMGVPFVRGLALGASAAVIVTVIASISLLPAMLGFIGNNIDKWGFHRGGVDTTKETVWHRWARFVQRRAWIGAFAGLAILAVLSIPMLSIRLGTADASADPPELTTRRAYDTLAEGFGKGFVGPFFIVSEIKNAEGEATIGKVYESIGAAALDGVARIEQIQLLDPQLAPGAPALSAADYPRLSTAVAYPNTSPQDSNTEILVRHLRESVVPSVLANNPAVDTFITGDSVVQLDFATVLGRRLPYFIGAVLGLSFLLLMAVFRSLLVPLKAVIMNLLSIGATYGILVAVFQWGWFADLVGVSTKAPIAAWAPMMLFAIVFGLSMDYEVFLLSRVREEYLITGNNDQAVVEGLASTARVITAAAAIMCCVFFSFVLGPLREIKMFGLGLGISVLLDATIVRMLLVPATMALLGKANWWMPRWLQRITPSLHIEGSSPSAESKLDPNGLSDSKIRVGN